MFVLVVVDNVQNTLPQLDCAFKCWQLLIAQYIWVLILPSLSDSWGCHEVFLSGCLIGPEHTHLIFMLLRC